VPPTSWRRDLGWLLALLAAALAFHAPVLFGGEAYYYEDYVKYYLPLKEHAMARLGRGEIPAWNPLLGLGGPLLANPAVGTFYPLSPLLWLGEASWALDLFLVLHLWLGGAFTYLCARERVGSSAPAFAAGIAFSFGGIALSYLTNPFYLVSLAWAPLFLWTYLRALWRSGWYALAAGGAVAMILLGGDAPLLLALGIPALALAISHAFAPDRPKGLALLRALGLAAAACAVGVLVAAVQIAPTLEAVGLTERGVAVSDFDQGALHFHPWRVFSFAVPYLFGTHFPEHSFWGFALHGMFRFWFYSVYVGAAFVPLWAIALWRGRRDPLTLALGVSALVLLFLAFGKHTPFFGAVKAVFPFLERLRYPEKFLAPLAITLPLLGALGMARASQGEGRWLGTGVSLALAAAGVSLWLAEPVLEDSISGWVGRPDVARAGAERIAADGRHLAAVGAALAAAIALRGAGRLGAGAFAGLAAAVVSLDLVLTAFGMRWTLDRGFHEIAPRASALARENGGRVLRDPAFEPPWVPIFPREEGWHRYEALLRHGLRPNTAMRDGLPSLFGFGAFRPRDVDEVLSAHAGRLTLLGALYDAPNLIVRRGRVPADVQRAVVQGHAVPIARLREADAHFVRLRGRRPRAFLSAEMTVETGSLGRAGELLAGALSRPVLDAEDALREGRPVKSPLAAPGASTGPMGDARITRDDPEQVEVEVRAPGPRVLVLSDAFFPGWRAFVDGAEVEIRRANFVARGVFVPAGSHLVRFSYQPPGLVAGAAVSGAATAMLALLGAFFLMRRLRRS
jgi:hypothetical protein